MHDQESNLTVLGLEPRCTSKDDRHPILRGIGFITALSDLSPQVCLSSSCLTSSEPRLMRIRRGFGSLPHGFRWSIINHSATSITTHKLDHPP